MKVKSESEVAQSCLTLSDPMDCRLPGSSVHGIFQARVVVWGAIAFSKFNLKKLQKEEQIKPSEIQEGNKKLQVKKKSQRKQIIFSWMIKKYNIQNLQSAAKAVFRKKMFLALNPLG